MSRIATTKEPQYEALVNLKKGKGLTTLGMMNNQVWQDDPRRLVFTLSRYKFVSKLLVGCNATFTTYTLNSLCYF